MSIKMRIIKDSDAICKICGATKEESLEIFEIMFIEKARLQLCDLCNNKLLYKTLIASNKVNGKMKSKKDLSILARRNERGEKFWYFDEE